MEQKKPTRRDLGRLLMIGLPGIELDDSTRQLINQDRVNNFILFRRNVDSPQQLTSLCHDIRTACAAAKLPAPLIAIDQEGGSVTRLPPPFTQFGHARDLATSPNPETTLADYAKTCASELLATGINLNLAPVLDVSPAGIGLFMEQRSLGGQPDQVGYLAAIIITEMQQNGLAACGKHFPGLGGAKLDPHETMPTVQHTADILDQIDLEPFRAAIKCGIACLMTSHTIYPALNTADPATLSKQILDDLLRADLGFEGLLLTDDLEMGAIENHGTSAEASLAAFKAGADLLLICHDHDKVRASLKTLQQAFGTQFPAQRLSQSLHRLNAVQNRYSLPLTGK